MTRLFVCEDLSSSVSLDLNEEDSRYISQVLRMRVGEEVAVVDRSGLECKTRVGLITKKQVRLDIFEKGENKTEPPVSVTLLQSVSKGERMDLTVQKATELGVSKIVPVISERCVVKLEKDPSGKVDRWQKIALEASRQSGRGKVPEVTLPVSFKEAVKMAGDYDLFIFPWEEEKGKGLKEALKKFKGKNIAVFTGPEGGFTQEEADEAVKAGALRVTLGPRILRTETAGAAVLAMIVYETEI